MRRYRNSQVKDNHREVVDPNKDLNHLGQACRCAVLVVHLGWVDRVPVVLAPMSSRDVSSWQHRVVVYRLREHRSDLRVYHLILLVAAAQECREGDSVGEVAVRTFGV